MGRGSLEPHRLLQAVASAHEVQALQVAASQVKVAAPVASYVVALCERSRQPGFAQSGLSTRAALTLMRSAMATALWSGRSFVTPDDVKAVARPVMAHRMNAVGSDGLAGSRAESEQLVERLLSDVAVPL